MLVILNVMAAAGLLAVLARHHFQAAPVDRNDSPGLDQRVRDLRMDGAPLRQVIRELEGQTGVKLVLSPSLATRTGQGNHGMVGTVQGWEIPIWGTLHDVRLGAALNALCRQGYFALPLHYGTLLNGRILLGADDEFPPIVRTYDVRNLTDLMPQPDTDSLISDDPDQGEGPARQFSTILMPTDQDRDGFQVDSRWWLVNGRLIVVGSRRAQRRIAEELGPLREIHGSFPAGAPLVARNILDLGIR